MNEKVMTYFSPCLKIVALVNESINNHEKNCIKLIESIKSFALKNKHKLLNIQIIIENPNTCSTDVGGL